MNPLSSLTPQEIESLHEVARGGLLQRRIPSAHRDKLLSLGLIAEKLGGDIATDKAKYALMQAGHSF